MSQGLILAFCTMMGFALAGAVSSLYQLVTSRTVEFQAFRQTAAGTAAALLISMFGGPFIVVRNILVGVRKRELGPVPVLVGLTISGIWSACAGVFFLSFVLLL